MISGDLPNALLDYSISLLDRAYEVADRCGELGLGTYSNSVGPHLRHVIEHYEALLLAHRINRAEAHSFFVDYDARPRDQSLEQDSHAARLRLRDLQTVLQSLRCNRSTTLDQVVTVRSLIGNAGQIELTTHSTLARELVFLASHTVHHFALLECLAKSRGKSFGVNFGRAPATVAHDRSQEKRRSPDEIDG